MNRYSPTPTPYQRARQARDRRSLLRRVVWPLLLAALLLGWLFPAAGIMAAPIDPTVQAAPASPPETQAAFERAREITDRAFAATQRGQLAKAEGLWSELIGLFPDHAELWSNRGNARAGQNHLPQAITDYDRAIELAPDQPDPYLNRGAALENSGHLREAIDDYNRVLAIDPNDAAAYNNRGNAAAAQGNWEAAIADYRQASDLARDFAIARVNYALALYQVGELEESLRHLRNIVRKYPTFADARAALTAALWARGDRGEAESQWVSVVGLDRHYKDLTWVAKTRRWPPAMVAALEKFLKL